jgi:hypothetical protein
MTVLEETLAIGRPNDDTVVSTASGKLLSIFLICNAIHGVTMSPDLLQTFACDSVINEYAVSYCNQQLRSIFKIQLSINMCIIPGLKQAAQTVLVMFDSAGGGG